MNQTLLVEEAQGIYISMSNLFLSLQRGIFGGLQ